MPQFQLRTLGTVTLVGRSPVPLDEPRLVALLVLLAIAGPTGVSDDELLLRLTPNETADRGRAEMARLIAVLRLRLGEESAIVRVSNGFALRPELMTLDVRVLAADAPNECAEFLLGFKLPGSPEFSAWLAATRRRVAPVVAEARTSRRTSAKLRIVAAAAVVSALAAAFYVSWPRSVQGFAAGDPLLVADVRNETGDSLFDRGISTATAVALQQSSHIRLYPRARLAMVYRLMQISRPDTALSFTLAREVALRDHVRFVLGLQIQRAGDEYRVTGQLADVAAANRVMTVSATARRKADVLSALDSVLLGVRRRLGETQREIADRRMPLPLVTTGSLEALRSFADGSIAWDKGLYPIARELLHRAVDLDSGFAMAYGGLGSYYYYYHDRDRGERYYGEALRRTNRLTEWEHLRLLAGLASYRGALDSAITLSRVMATRYPSSANWYSYGTQLMTARRDSEALTALRTAISYDSTYVNAFINMAVVQRRLGRLDDALRSYARAGQLDSLILYQNNQNHEWGGIFVQLGRYAEAESAFSRMARAPRVADRALGFRSLGYLALWQGRVDDAMESLKQATEAAAQTNSPLGVGRNRMLLASAYRSIGRYREANDEVTKTLLLAQAPPFEPRALAMVATSCFKLGRVADVEAVLRLLRARMNRENSGDVAAEAYVSGLISLARHRADSAVYFARSAAKLPEAGERLTLAAEAFRAAGRLDSAQVAVSALIRERGFGSEGQEDWLRAPLVLGDLMLAQNDTAGAITQFQRVIDQRRSAPPEVTDVAAARTRLASLRQGRDQSRR